MCGTRGPIILEFDSRVSEKLHIRKSKTIEQNRCASINRNSQIDLLSNRNTQSRERTKSTGTFVAACLATIVRTSDLSFSVRLALLRFPDCCGKPNLRVLSARVLFTDRNRTEPRLMRGTWNDELESTKSKFVVCQSTYSSESVAKKKKNEKVQADHKRSNRKN